MNRINYLFIFDLDGTLIDSNHQIANNLNRARKDMGFKALEQRFYSEHIGLPIDFLISDLALPQLEHQNLIDRFRRYLTKEIRTGRNKIFEGVEQALQFLSSSGASLAIATNKPTSIAKDVIAHSELAKYIFYIQGVENFKPKPSPDIIFLILQRFPDKYPVMVGDRIEDMKAARAAGVPGIGIASGAHSKESLVEHGACKVFSNFREFSCFLESKEFFFF